MRRLDRTGALAFAFFALFFAAFFAPAEGAKIMASGDAVYQSIPALLGSRHCPIADFVQSSERKDTLESLLKCAKLAAL